VRAGRTAIKLLEKFPDTVIFAQQAEFEIPLDSSATQEQIKSASRKLKTNGQSIFPEFSAKLGTDVTLVGFNMSRQTALGQNSDDQFLHNNAGYYFALQERPGQLRFGADASTNPEYTSWDHLAWDVEQLIPGLININTSLIDPPSDSNVVPWGESSANMASILCQQPVIFLVHANDMIG
jgi:hypothetical protein